MRTARLAFLALALACNGGGGASPGTGGNGGAGGSGGAPAADAAPGACLATASELLPDDGGMHAPECRPLTWRTNPPSSGTHYPIWAAPKEYAQPVPWGYLVHVLEHGGVVVVYNCPSGCAAELDQARAMIAALPARAGCTRADAILAPDPSLETTWAAAAWRRTLTAPCFLPDAFAQFAQSNLGKGTEDIPCDTVAVDKSAAGWCPGVR